MNHYKARQRKDGRWDYTCANDGKAWPVGYCHEYREPDPEDWIWKMHPDDAQRVRDNKDKYHGCGHATEEEAQACYKKYLLENELSLNRKSSNAQYKCKVCGEWTQLFAEVDWHIFNLCEKHQNLESVEPLFQIGESWSS